MTDITELALLVSKAKASVFTLEYISQFEPADIDSDDVDLRFEVDGRDTGTNVSIVDECGQAAKVIGTLVEALEKAQQVDEELCKLLPPGAEYMDPPDGGDVTPLEGVRRMVADYRQRIAELREWNAGLARESFERQQRISELLEGKVGNALLERENHHVKVVDKLTEHINQLESRTVKLTNINEYLAEVHDKTLNRAFRLLAEGVRAGDVAAMRAAGIKVETE
ncbi:hypothetical protein LVU53_10975 [Klebsiella pneumoniae]|nr:hypothetical protein [Klebsiella pneumoniae]HCI6996653.1 hypothetical protein [Klebsiella pneumoniae]